MHTFRDLLSIPGHTLRAGEILTLPQITEIVLPRQRNLRLPRSLDAYGNLTAPQSHGFPEVFIELLPVARMRLFSEPHLVFEGPRPTAGEIIALGADEKRAPTLGARRLVLATAINLGEGVLYGEADAIYLEQGAGFGRAQLLAFRDKWTEDLSELALWIATDMEGVVTSVDIRPEPGSSPWRQVALLLGGGASKDLPRAWQQVFRFAAGLFCFDLGIRTDPDAKRKTVLAEIRRHPPDALLVWRRWIPRPNVYIEQYKIARHNGLAELIGEPHAESSLDFHEYIFELTFHLDTVADLSDGAETQVEIESWEDAEKHILALECEYFHLTSTARESLIGNSYPDPNRMYTYLERLSRFAAHYAAMAASIGNSIEAVAVKYQLEVALHDDSLGEPTITTDDGRTLSTIPHVKVDDYKSPDECGRIYFALDPIGLCFIVDHIGLHNY